MVVSLNSRLESNEEEEEEKGLNSRLESNKEEEEEEGGHTGGG